MAKMTPKLPEELLKKLSRLGTKTDEICEHALKAGAEIAEDAVATNLSGVVGVGTKVKSRSTGELQAALGISPVLQGKDGNLNIKVGFDEPRSSQPSPKGKRSYNEVTNAMIANVLEYGKHGQPAKPFLAPAKRKSRKAVVEKMKDVLEKEMNGA